MKNSNPIIDRLKEKGLYNKPEMSLKELLTAYATHVQETGGPEIAATVARMIDIVVELVQSGTFDQDSEEMYAELCKGGPGGILEVQLQTGDYDDGLYEMLYGGWLMEEYGDVLNA